MGRVEWAVEAAEHTLPVVKIIWGACDTIDGERALEEARLLYRSLLYYIGTIPGDQAEWVFDATVTGGMTVTAALDAIGA